MKKKDAKKLVDECKEIKETMAEMNEKLNRVVKKASKITSEKNSAGFIK